MVKYGKNAGLSRDDEWRSGGKGKRPKKNRAGYLPPLPRPWTKEDKRALRKMSDKGNWKRKDGMGEEISGTMFMYLKRMAKERAKVTGREYTDFQLLMELREYKKTRAKNMIKMKFD